jgi:hypothetical protein
MSIVNNDDGVCVRFEWHVSQSKKPTMRRSFDLSASAALIALDNAGERAGLFNKYNVRTLRFISLHSYSPP